MGFNEWIHVLWLIELALEPVVVLSLLAKKTWKRFPLFTAYCVWAMVADVATYIAFQHPRMMFQVYLVNETLAMILALGLIYEIFAHLFQSQPALRHLATITFRVVCAGLVLLGAVVLYAHSPVGAKGIYLTVLVVEETYRILEVGLIMFLFLFSSAFGLQWRAQVFGIVLGLGVATAVKLAAVTVAPQSYTVAGIVNLTTMLAYDVGCLIWIAYVLAPERITIPAELPKTAQLQQWNQAIMELINQ